MIQFLAAIRRPRPKVRKLLAPRLVSHSPGRATRSTVILGDAETLQGQVQAVKPIDITVTDFVLTSGRL
jgi:hypothetical protein